MWKISFVVASLLLLVVGAMRPAQSDHLARAFLRDGAGRSVGQVNFEDLGGTVYVRVILERVAPGWHAVHIHSVGDCTPPAFPSAGTHFNPGHQLHPGHAGDLPVVYVISDGTADMLFKTDRFALADLFDGDGSSIILCSGPDNFSNIPNRYRSSETGAPSSGPDRNTLSSGDTGAPLACGVVVR
jgi:Cu-Zn family superoxide dismutase